MYVIIFQVLGPSSQRQDLDSAVFPHHVDVVLLPPISINFETAGPASVEIGKHGRDARKRYSPPIQVGQR